MKGLAFSSMRVGKKYRLTNYGDTTEFVLMEVFGEKNHRIKDIYTLEEMRMTELMTFGMGEDFEIVEISK